MQSETAGGTLTDLPKTGAEAKALGLLHYFTGKPCKQGHVAKRYVSNGKCVECRRKLERKWRGKNREKHREQVRKWSTSNPEKRMLVSARCRARDKGVPFRLKLADIRVPSHCPVLGMPLSAGGDSRDDSPSIDRLVPEIGYVPRNIRVISWRANMIKGNATSEELRKVADWVAEEERIAEEVRNK